MFLYSLKGRQCHWLILFPRGVLWFYFFEVAMFRANSEAIFSHSVEYATWSPWSNVEITRTNFCGFIAKIFVTLQPHSFWSGKLILSVWLSFIVNGNFSEWTLWTPCSVTCGQGIMTRKRFCTNPTPTIGGKDCTDLGPDQEKTSCQLVDCRGTTLK